jgi:hypothetical protein
MKRWWILKALKILLFVAAAVGIAGYLVMTLWNWLLPPLFGWHALGFAQALGLLLLSRLLFGGFRGHRGHRGAWKERMRSRWEAMTPEERERVRSAWQGRRGHCRGGSAGAPP